MGLKEAFSKIFKSQEKEKTVEQRLSKLGIDVVSDRKLEQRIRLTDLLHDELEKPIETEDPLERIEILRDRLQTVNRALKVISVPYGRAGDFDRFRFAMMGWESLYSVSMDIINTVEGMIKNVLTGQEQMENSVLNVEEAEKTVEQLLNNGKANSKQIVQALLNNSRQETYYARFLKMNVAELERKLESFLQVEVFPYAFLIADVSYYDRDVAPSYTTIVQSYGPYEKIVPMGFEKGLEPKKEEEE